MHVGHADDATHVVVGSVHAGRVKVGFDGEVLRAHVKSRIGGVVDGATIEVDATGADTSGIAGVHDKVP